MRNKQKQKGATLIELILVISIIAYITILAFAQKQLEMDQHRAKEVGAELFMYNNAVRSWMANNTDVTPLNITRVGATWLKPDSCGGSSGRVSGYLPCNFNNGTVAQPIPFGNLVLTTNITRTFNATPGEGVRFNANTTTTPFIIPSYGSPNKVRGDLSGLAALVAASGHVLPETPSMATSDGRFQSDPATAIITMQANNQPGNDVWLRTDGQNSMQNNLTFNQARSALLRQIHGVSRIHGAAFEVLYLGNHNNIAGLPVNGGGSIPLVSERVVIDTNARIYGSLRANNSLTALTGSITATVGDVNAGRDLRAARDTYVGNSLSAGNNIDAVNTVSGGGILSRNNVVAQTDVIANRDVYASRDVSAVRRVLAGESIVSPVFYDGNDLSYRVDPNGASRLNHVAALLVEANDTSPSGTLHLRGNNITLGSHTGAPSNLNGNITTWGLNIMKNGRLIPFDHLIPNFVHRASWYAANGTWVPKPNCAGGTPRIIVTPQTIPTNTMAAPAPGYSPAPVGAAFFYANDVGSHWITIMNSAEQSFQGDPRGIASTYCLY